MSKPALAWRKEASAVEAVPVPAVPQVRPWLDEAELSQVAAVLRSGWITEGPRAQEFTARLDALIGVPHGVLAPNGTLALTLGLLALGVGPGDEVLLPDITFIGSATAVILAGATPIWVDVDRDQFQIDLERAAALLSPRTRAIMPVHLFGTACAMDAVLGFARHHGLAVIEDAAQGIGVRWRGQPVGSFGDVGCFSFFADKTITTGEGGYVACSDPAIHERLLRLRNQGRPERGTFIHPALGFNFRVTDLQCAVGLAQLDRLDRILARKAVLHRRYRENLAGLDALRILGAAPGANLVPFRCVLIAERAGALMRHLADGGIQTRSFFYPLHRQPGLKDWAARLGLPARLFDDDAYPNAVFGWDHGVCLPVYPTLGLDEVDRICDLIAGFYRG